MKATAKSIARYVNEQLDQGKGNNISIGLPKLRKVTLEALRDNYNFTTVRDEGFMGYVHFKR